MTEKPIPSTETLRQFVAIERQTALDEKRISIHLPLRYCEAIERDSVELAELRHRMQSLEK